MSVRHMCTRLSGEVGSLSIIGAVSPPSADFSEPVTTHTRRYVHCFWALDATRAQARFYPAVHPLQSYSQDIEVLSHFWNQHGNPDWLEQRRRFLGLLEEQAHLERMARIVGKDALPPRQQHVLLCAELINEAFLRQSAFSERGPFLHAGPPDRDDEADQPFHRPVGEGRRPQGERGGDQYAAGDAASAPYG